MEMILSWVGWAAVGVLVTIFAQCRHERAPQFGEVPWR